MSTLDDLQQVLSTHAAEAVDAGVGTGERVAAVHGRVRAVRRRRRAAGALAAVAVVAAGAALWVPGREGPAPAVRPTIGGQVAPKTITSLGYGYDFERSDTGDGKATLRLPTSDRPRLVSWAGSGTLRLRTVVDGIPIADTPADTVTGEPFTGFVLVPSDVREVTLTGSARVGLAVYALATRAPGVTQHGLTWRYDVAGDQLLQAVTGTRGETRLTGTVTLPQDRVDPDPGLSLRPLCADAPSGTTVDVSLAGKPAISVGCQDDETGATTTLPWDAVTVAGSFSDVDPSEFGRPGQTVPFAVSLSDSSGEAVTTAPDALLGAGIYLTGPAGGRVGSDEVPEVYEEGGHTYRLQRIRTSEPGERSLRATVTAGRTPILARMVTSAALPGYTRILGDGKEIARLGDAAGGSSQATAALLMDADAKLEIRVAKAGPTTVLGLATYEQVD